MGLSETYEKSTDRFKPSTATFDVDLFKLRTEISVETTTSSFITAFGKVKTDLPVPLPSSQNNSTQGAGIKTPSKVSRSVIQI